MKNNKDNCGIMYAQNLNLIAVSFANALACELTEEEILVLAAFFEVVGDALALIPSVTSMQNSICSKSDTSSNTNLNDSESGTDNTIF